MNLEDLPALVERSFQGVAEIEVWKDEQCLGGGTGFIGLLNGEGDGSGDLVFTNAHVADAGPEMRVFFRDGKESSGHLVGAHPMVDVALFRLDEAKPGALNLRGRGEFKLGEFVVALGHPKTYSWTVTAGLISGLDRPETHHNSGLPMTMLQTSAEINQGNSGGPLIGLDGAVVGINTSGRTQQETLFKVDFAIPAHSASLAAQAILDAEHEDHVPRPWTGLPILRRPWKAPQEVLVAYGIKGGAEVGNEPEAGSPASDAGLRAGDVVVQINDTSIDDPGDIYTWMLDPACLEREFELQFIRDGEVKSTVLKAVDRNVEE